MTFEENDSVKFVKDCINYIRESYSPEWACSDWGASIEWQDRNEEYVFFTMEKVLASLCQWKGDDVFGDSALNKRIQNSKMIISNPEFGPFDG